MLWSCASPIPFRVGSVLDASPASATDAHTDRTAMIPRRKQAATKIAATASTKNAAKEPNSSEEERQRQPWLAANYQPPPF